VAQNISYGTCELLIQGGPRHWAKLLLLTGIGSASLILSYPIPFRPSADPDSTIEFVSVAILIVTLHCSEVNGERLGIFVGFRGSGKCLGLSLGF
jgi:hypothetical protein